MKQLYTSTAGRTTSSCSSAMTEQQLLHSQHQALHAGNAVHASMGHECQTAWAIADCLHPGSMLKGTPSVCCSQCYTAVCYTLGHAVPSPLTRAPVLTAPTFGWLGGCRALRRKIGGTARDYWKDWVEEEQVKNIKT